MLRKWFFVLICCVLIALAYGAAVLLVPEFGSIKRYEVAQSRLRFSEPEEGNWRAEFVFRQLPDQSPYLQLYLPSHGGKIKVWLDGKQIAEPRQHLDARLNRNRLVTVVDLPATLIVAGDHQLVIAQSGNYQGAPLMPIYLGPRQAIGAVSSTHLTVGPVIRSLIPFAGVFVTLLSGLLIFFSAQPRKYILLAAAIVIQVLIEFDDRIWLFGHNLRHYAAFTVLIRDMFRALAFIDWLEIKSKHTKWVLAISCSIIAFYLILDSWKSITNVELFPLISNIYIAETLATAIYFVIMMYKNEGRGGVIRHLALGAFAFLITPALAYLIMYDFSAPVEDVFIATNYVNIATAFGIFSLVAGALVGEIVQYRAQTSQIVTMHGIVAGHHLELDQRSKALKESIEQRAVLQERERFTRDMHDGIGGQLLNMLLKARQGGVDASVLQQDIETSIHDLRLVTASLDGNEDGLNAALDNFRARAEGQLAVAGMELDWRCASELSDIAFGPRETLDILRILQEALTNAIRHAGATRFSVAAKSDNKRLNLSLADDGRGVDPANTPRGGLRNMRARVEKLGGTMELVSEGGLRIEIIIPT